MFIVTVMMMAAAVSVYAIEKRMPAESREFLVIMAMAVVAARLKLTLPGFESNMSMNLPFILLAISELSMPEAIAVGAASTFVQTLPRSGQKVTPTQAVFNVCNMVNAVAIASVVAGRAVHFVALNRPFLIAAAALAFFVADTVPVAAIISMTSPAKTADCWTGIALTTFPYFVLSAGVACIITTGIQVVGWVAGATTLAVMSGVYRCFRFYFQNARALASVSQSVHQAAGAD
jgi:hypothetical protein